MVIVEEEGDAGLRSNSGVRQQTPGKDEERDMLQNNPPDSSALQLNSVLSCHSFSTMYSDYITPHCTVTCNTIFYHWSSSKGLIGIIVIWVTV